MKISMRQRNVQVGLIAVCAIVMTGIAFATIPDDDGSIHACYTKSGGTLRVIDAGVTTCKQGETELQWNVQGQPGIQGPPGAMGPAGPAGLSLFANVTGSGNLTNGTATSAVRTGTGSYRVTFVQDVANCAPVVTPGSTDAGVSNLNAWPNTSTSGGTPNDVFVRFNRPGSPVDPVDTDFHLIVAC